MNCARAQLVGHRRAAIGIQFDLRQILNEFARQFPWRSRDSIDRAVALSLERVLAEPSSDADIRVAEDACGEPLGFVHLQTATHFTGEIRAHISDLAGGGSRRWIRLAPRG